MYVTIRKSAQWKFWLTKTLIYIPEEVLQFLRDFGNGFSSCCSRQSIQWRRISLMWTNIEYYSLNSTANVSSEVLFHQFILTLYWFAMLIRESLWPEGSQYFLVYFDWWFFSGLLWLGQSQFREGIKIIRYTSQHLLFETGSSFKSLFKSVWIIYSFFFKRKHSTFFSSRYFNNNSYNNNNMPPTLARHLSHLY